MKNDVVVLLPNYNDARGLKKSLSKNGCITFQVTRIRGF